MWTFEYTETTEATPQAIWQRWAAVSDWPTQNPLLVSAELEGPFAIGSKITLKPKKGPKSTLVIAELTENKAWTGKGKIPLGELRVEHSMQVMGSQTEFTHRIVITGPLNKLFAGMVGKNMAAVLPDMMKTIAQQAKSGS